VLVFGDRIQIGPGELALQAGGIFALIVGVILVGRAPALSQLRGWTPPSLPHLPGSLPTLPNLPNLPSLPSLPGLPGLPGLTGRRSADEDQADKDQSLRPGGDAYASGSGHSNGDGQTNGYANVDGRSPPDLARAQDSTPADEAADHPNPLRRPALPINA
jgi:hypothetical protein